MLLSDVTKDPSLARNNQRMKFVLDFASYVERNPGVYKKIQGDVATDTIIKNQAYNQVYSSAMPNANNETQAGKKYNTKQHLDQVTRAGEIVGAKHNYVDENNLDKYFGPENLERRRRKARDFMVANNIDPDDKYVNKPGERRRCPVCSKNTHTYRFHGRWHLQSNEAKKVSSYGSTAH